MGVELGQIAALSIVFPLLLIVRGRFFQKISILSNWGLIIVGGLLLIYQLSCFFTLDTHHHNEKNNNQIEVSKGQHNHKDESHKYFHHHGDHDKHVHPK